MGKTLTLCFFRYFLVKYFKYLRAQAQNDECSFGAMRVMVRPMHDQARCILLEPSPHADIWPLEERMYTWNCHPGT